MYSSPNNLGRLLKIFSNCVAFEISCTPKPEDGISTVIRNRITRQYIPERSTFLIFKVYDLKLVRKFSGCPPPPPLPREKFLAATMLSTESSDFI